TFVRSTGAYQPMMIEERAAKRRLEEMVRKNIVAGPLPDAHFRTVVIAHRQSTHVRERRKPVVRAARDLFLMHMEKVDRILGAHGEWQIYRWRIDLERPIGKIPRECRVRPSAVPDR